MGAVAVAEIGDEACVADVVGPVFQPDALVRLPIDAHDGVGHGIPRPESDDAAVERRHWNGVARDEPAVHVQLEVVVGVDVARDLDAVLVDHHRFQLRRIVRDVSRSRAVVEDVHSGRAFVHRCGNGPGAPIRRRVRPDGHRKDVRLHVHLLRTCRGDSRDRPVTSSQTGGDGASFYGGSGCSAR